MIKFEQVSFTYNHKTPFAKPIFNNFNFEINPNTMTIITGKSGSGKTTIMKLLCNLNKPTSGTITYNNQPVNKQNNLHHKVGFLLQSSHEQIIYDTVYNEINMSYKLKFNQDISEAEVQAQLKQFKLNKQLTDNPNYFSGGEKKILALITLAVLQLETLILDEPFIGLDSTHKQVIREFLKRVKTEKTIIIITHENDYIYDLVDQYLIVDSQVLGVNTQNMKYDQYPIKCDALQILNELNLNLQTPRDQLKEILNERLT